MHNTLNTSSTGFQYSLKVLQSTCLRTGICTRMYSILKVAEEDMYCWGIGVLTLTQACTGQST